MNFIISLNNSQTELATIDFDTFGNLYFHFRNIIYQINILDTKIIFDTYIQSYPSSYSCTITYSDDEIEDTQLYCTHDLSEYDFGKNNIPFNFSDHSINSILIENRDDICALYDTYIYQNNKIYFSSLSYAVDSIFIIQIENNKIGFKFIHDTNLIMYYVTFNDQDNLLCIVTDESLLDISPYSLTNSLSKK
jgi:hypothetical protein